MAVITLLGHGIAFLQSSQIQPLELIYTNPKDPVRLKLTGKILEVINYSDLEVKALSFGCITKDSDRKIKVQKRITSIEYFDLQNMNLAPADRQNSTFSFFSFSVSESNVKQCSQGQALFAVVEVWFTDDSVWKITP